MTLIHAQPRIRFATLTAAALGMATLSLGMAVAPSRTADPATITLDPVHSVALFRIQHLEAGLFWGRFNALEGTVKWTMEPTAAPVFDIAAKIANADTGSERLDGNLQGPNFFNAKEFPTITFKSTGATVAGDRHWMVKGDLTLHGVTKPVEVDCVATGIGTGPAGTKVGFECNLTLKRSDFGMKWGIEKPAKALGDEVKLIIALEGDAVGGTAQ